MGDLTSATFRNLRVREHAKNISCPSARKIHLKWWPPRGANGSDIQYSNICMNMILNFNYPHPYSKFISYNLTHIMKKIMLFNDKYYEL